MLFAEVPGFYAAVERADDPSLAERPVIVGGDPRKRGLVQAATPDALAAGVRPEMTVLEALRVCPRAKRVRTDMPRYREMSRHFFALLRRVCAQLEPFGLGAAYFDIRGDSSAPEEIAGELRAVVGAELGLTLRVGIASGKFLARISAEESGEGGVHRILSGSEQSFLAVLPLTRLEGVGEKTAARLAELGAATIDDVAALGRERLQEVFGTHGLRIEAFARGSDPRPVRAARHPQSLSREATIPEETLDLSLLTEQLLGISQRLENELRLQGLVASKIVLRLRFADQERATPSLTLPAPSAAAAEIHGRAIELLGRTQAGSRPVRGLGIQLSRLALAGEQDRQLDLFPDSAG